MQNKNDDTTTTTSPSRGIVKGLAALLQNPKVDPNTVFPNDLSAKSSLRRLHQPFSFESEDSFKASHSRVMEDGCYLIYDNASNGTLVLNYSHQAVPENAVGFWKPGKDKTIQSWKYEGAGGYSELLRGIVGGTQNNKRYYKGWCQFVQLAKSMKGEVKKIDIFYDPQNDKDNNKANQRLPVDLYGYAKGNVIRPLSQNGELAKVTDLEAVACVPRHNDRFKGVHQMEKVAFMNHGNLEGAVLALHD